MYISAFEDMVIRPNNSIRAGRVVTPPPHRIASGVKHAYREGDTETLCGRDLDGLYLEPLIPFGYNGQHCTVCLPATDERQAGPTTSRTCYGLNSTHAVGNPNFVPGTELRTTGLCDAR